MFRIQSTGKTENKFAFRFNNFHFFNSMLYVFNQCFHVLLMQIILDKTEEGNIKVQFNA